MVITYIRIILSDGFSQLESIHKNQFIFIVAKITVEMIKIIEKKSYFLSPWSSIFRCIFLYIIKYTCLNYTNRTFIKCYVAYVMLYYMHITYTHNIIFNEVKFVWINQWFSYSKYNMYLGMYSIHIFLQL